MKKRATTIAKPTKVLRLAVTTLRALTLIELETVNGGTAVSKADPQTCGTN